MIYTRNIFSALQIIFCIETQLINALLNGFLLYMTYRLSKYSLTLKSSNSHHKSPFNKLYIQYNTIQYIAIQYNTIQYKQYNTIQNKQYNTMQYNELPIMQYISSFIYKGSGGIFKSVIILSI